MPVREEQNDRFPLIVMLSVWNLFWGVATGYLLVLSVAPQDIEGHPTLLDAWPALAVTGSAFGFGTLALIVVVRNSLRQKALAKTRGFPVHIK